MIGALQAHTDNFQIHEPMKDKTRSVSVATTGTDPSRDDYKESGDVTLETGKAESKASGHINIRSGLAFNSGNVDIEIGESVSKPGTLTLKGGSS